MLRTLTPTESLRLTLLGATIRDEVDVPLGDALLAVAAGDDGQLAAVHDRLAVIGRHELADRLRWLVQ